MTAVTFRTAPIPAWQLAKGDHIVTGAPPGTVVHDVRTGDVTSVQSTHGPFFFRPHEPVHVKAPSGPHPVDGWATWWRTPSEFSPCTCLHRPRADGNWVPAGLDEGCREHAGVQDEED